MTVSEDDCPIFTISNAAEVLERVVTGVKHESSFESVNIKRAEKSSVPEQSGQFVTTSGDDDNDSYVDVAGSMFCSRPLYFRLFGFQKEGVRFLCNAFRSKEPGVILADDMGLGKTVQVISFLVSVELSRLGASGSKYLVVSPATLVAHWRQEISKWSRWGGVLRKMHILVVSYDQLRSDAASLGTRNERTGAASVLSSEYDVAVFDEAHRVKNSETKIAKVCTFRVKAKFRIAISSTPVQNSLMEIWSICNMITGGRVWNLLGTLSGDIVQDSGRSGMSTRQSAALSSIGSSGGALKGDSLAIARRLRTRLKHVMLRRRRTDELAAEMKLKENSDSLVFVQLSSSQKRDYYVACRKLAEYQTIWGTHRFSAEAFRCVHVLRRIVNGVPYSEEAKIPVSEECQRSSKLAVTMEFLNKWCKAEGRLVVVFSQSLAVLGSIQRQCLKRQISLDRIDGSTPLDERKDILSFYSSEFLSAASAPSPMAPTSHDSAEGRVLICTSRVGAYGVNLTRVTRILLFDPDWNPMVDRQAAERAHRPGMVGDVQVFRLVASDTIEEYVLKKQLIKETLCRLVSGDNDEESADPKKVELEKRLKEARKTPTSLSVTLRAVPHEWATVSETRSASETCSASESELVSYIQKVMSADSKQGNGRVVKRTSAKLDRQSANGIFDDAGDNPLPIKDEYDTSSDESGYAQFRDPVERIQVSLSEDLVRQRILASFKTAKSLSSASIVGLFSDLNVDPKRIKSVLGDLCKLNAKTKMWTLK